MAPKHDPAEAERLKALGNELYQSGEYEAARHKYTLAIEKDPENAVLYANRAAAMLGAKQYLDAAFDCKKAVDLDPTYAKAWGRLGTATHALASWQECIKAWKKALECLPRDNLTPTQQTMKQQFTQGLQKARVASKKIETGLETIGADTQGQRPWEIAESLHPAKVNAGKPSCVFTLCYAYKDFQEALKYLSELKMVTHPGLGVPALAGNPNVLEPLSNSILTDERAFHISDQDFTDKIQKQCMFESQCLRGWATEAGPSTMKDEILKRLKSEPWSKVRPSISVTVRVWVFQAFFRSQLLGHNDFAHEALTRALDFLEWGRKQFPNVPKEERGAIFEKSWIRGVKKQHLNLMHQSLATKGDKSPFTHQELVDTAEDLIQDVDSDPAVAPGGELHIGHFLAFWVYPKAQALSIIGWSSLQMGLRAPHGDPNRSKVLRLAAENYLAAAKLYPEDDEFHPMMLRKHLECLCLLDKPLRVTLPICEKIRDVMPQSMEIWKVGPGGRHSKDMLQELTEFASHWRTEIKEGRATMESINKISMPTVPKLKTEKDDLPIRFTRREDDDDDA